MAIETTTGEISPAERRRRKVRDSIIGAAEAIFTREGEAGISMRRLAEAIDYSPAAIYKYFDSKEALFEEIREQFFARLMGRLEHALAEGGDIHVLCNRCMKAYIETGLEEPNHYRMAFSLFDDRKYGPDDDSYGMQAALHLEEMIRAGIEQGVYREVDPGAATASVWAALHGLTMLMVSKPDFPGALPVCENVSRDTLIEFHADMILRGLVADAR
ncbi:MAG: TetR/AcrR family transcriptional regulator [Maricaulaceae bacterium]|nr:TetR/AcrR family transcriptional regulator [Maricaulaceae bacterium]